jgi:hypothetical protein
MKATKTWFLQAPSLYSTFSTSLFKMSLSPMDLMQNGKKASTFMLNYYLRSSTMIRTDAKY